MEVGLRGELERLGSPTDWLQAPAADLAQWAVAPSARRAGSRPVGSGRKRGQWGGAYRRAVSGGHEHEAGGGRRSGAASGEQASALLICGRIRRCGVRAEPIQFGPLFLYIHTQLLKWNVTRLPST